MQYLKRFLTAGTWLVVATAVASEPLPPVINGTVDESVQSDSADEGHPDGASPGCCDFHTRYLPPVMSAGEPYTPPPPACGCHDKWKQHWWEKWGYPGENLPGPMGVGFHGCLAAQVQNGLAAQLVLYRYDFQQPRLDRDPSALIAHGQLRLTKLANVLASAPVPLVIETTGDASLDAARRGYVLRELNRILPFPTPAEKVVTGRPVARGLDGVEADIMDGNLLDQTRHRGLSQMPSIPGRILSPIMQAPPDINSDASSR